MRLYIDLSLEVMLLYTRARTLYLLNREVPDFHRWPVLLRHFRAYFGL